MFHFDSRINFIQVKTKIYINLANTRWAMRLLLLKLLYSMKYDVL